ncbi:hypothetical protein F2Q68_00014873 [Brassica cretica]|uniref:Uncharacterized protein n=1 Tax=Brassica cretica TaxID=69181 RepID=A0A8S9HMN5_BRACR|nr:hypothetical protein F2Q68_00014873 [Brassica cretica]
MDGVPDLSALLKGKLQLISKKSTPANVQGSTSSDGGGASKERAPGLVNEGVGAEPSASSPKKKKKSRKAKRKATDEVPLEETASLDETSEGLEARKKKGGRKRPYEGATSSVDQEEASTDRPRKKKKKKSIEAEPRPSDVEATLVDVATRGGVSPETPLEKKRKVSTRGSGSGSDPAASERSAPDPCAELTRQIRGGTKEMPQLKDLYFKNEYVDAASSRVRSDGSMNFLVEKYDSALKQTMIQLGSSEKLAQARLKAIERVRAEHKKANEKVAKEKEILRVKFEELEGKLKSASAAKKELARENTRLEQAAATLEKEKTELLEERDAAVEKLIGERQRLRDSRGLEVTRERERVEAAMVEKANRCFGRVRDHFTRLDAFGKAKNLYGQASGTKKCLEMIKASGTEIPQEMIDVFAERKFDQTGDGFSAHYLARNYRGAIRRAIGDTPVREEETKNVGIEDPVLVSDSSSEGREDEEEEDDRVEETSPPQPVEEETTNKFGAATGDPVGPPALGTPEEDDQDYAP